MVSVAVLWCQRSAQGILNASEAQRWGAVVDNPLSANLMTVTQFIQQCTNTPRAVNDVVFVGTFAIHEDYQACAKILNTLPVLLRIAIVSAHSQLFQLRIGAFQNVTDIAIRSCQLTQIPLHLFMTLGRHHLRYIDLSKNLLTDVSPLCNFLPGCFNLETINLSKNRLTDFPHVISSITTLSYVNLSGNQLSEVKAEDVKMLAKLKSMDISHNINITELPAELVQSAYLVRLDLTGLVSLRRPRYELAKKGLDHIKKYFEDRSKTGWMDMTKSGTISTTQ